MLSPGAVRVDKVKKMPLYARCGVGRLWLIDPAAKSLDVFVLEQGRRVVAGSYADDDKARIEPFREVELHLADPWM